jgi:hypothetical protein
MQRQCCVAQKQQLLQQQRKEWRELQAWWKRKIWSCLQQTQCLALMAATLLLLLWVLK